MNGDNIFSGEGVGDRQVLVIGTRQNVLARVIPTHGIHLPIAIKIILYTRLFNQPGAILTRTCMKLDRVDSFANERTYASIVNC